MPVLLILCCWDLKVPGCYNLASALKRLYVPKSKPILKLKSSYMWLRLNRGFFVLLSLRKNQTTMIESKLKLLIEIRCNWIEIFPYHSYTSLLWRTKKIWTSTSISWVLLPILRVTGYNLIIGGSPLTVPCSGTYLIVASYISVQHGN